MMVLVHVKHVGVLKIGETSEKLSVSACEGLEVMVILMFPTVWYIPV